MMGMGVLVLSLVGVRCGFEGFFDGLGDLLGDAELVDHPRDDQPTAMDMESGGVLKGPGARWPARRLTA